MTGQELPVVTNISTAVRPGKGVPGLTLVAVEATGRVAYVFETRRPDRPVVRLCGVRTRMPDQSIGVHDGLLSTVEVRSIDDSVRICLALEHPTILVVREQPGMPARLCLELSRAPLWRILHGRRIVVDPGHGGDDTGGRGPVDLLEKTMTLAVAGRLGKQLVEAGCGVVTTRGSDANPVWGERCALAAREKADAMVSLHTAWFPDPAVAGIAVYWLNQEGQPLAARIHSAFLRKLPLPDRGRGMGNPRAELDMPVAIAEFATISNPVEEGWLRSSTFIDRAAGAVLNGLKDYFAGGREPGRTRQTGPDDGRLSPQHPPQDGTGGIGALLQLRQAGLQVGPDERAARE